MVGTSRCSCIVVIQVGPKAAVFEAACYLCNFLNNLSVVEPDCKIFRSEVPLRAQWNLP